MYKVLILWSGGLDSTACLYWHLKNTDYQIHVHHVKLLNRGKMMTRQLDAVGNMNPILQKIRPFELTTSTQYAHILGDVFICVVDGMRIAYAKEYDEVIVSTTINEGPPWPVLRMVHKVVQAANQNDVYTKHRIKFKTPFRKTFTKEMCWNELPKELQEKVWWCRSHDGELCSECFQCTEMKKFKEIK